MAPVAQIMDDSALNHTVKHNISMCVSAAMCVCYMQMTLLVSCHTMTLEINLSLFYSGNNNIKTTCKQQQLKQLLCHCIDLHLNNRYRIRDIETLLMSKLLAKKQR